MRETSESTKKSSPSDEKKVNPPVQERKRVTMKRAPLVMMGTVAGLAGVLSFNSTPAKLTLGSLASSSSGTSSAPSTTTTASSSPPPTTATSTVTTPPTSAPTTTTTSAPPVTTTTVSSSVRTAIGPSVDYNFGILSVQVKVTGSKITNVSIASINDGGNYRSVSIDQQAIPLLEQEVMQAQSGNIQSISGASYTSAGFIQSLQSALSKLGL